MTSRLCAMMAIAVLTICATSKSPAARPTTAPASGITTGKVGQRVESGGLAITIVRVTRQPERRWKDLIRVQEDEKWLDLEILLENRTGEVLSYYPSLMKIKDSEDQEYGHDAIVGVGQPLEFGTIPQGQKVRGHLSYTLPKSAKGLRFTYSLKGQRNYKPIYVELGE